MEALLNIVEDETALVREGRLGEIQRLQAAKSALARDYVADTTQLEASRAFLSQIMPSALSALRTRHDQFRALLQVNLTVLATVHAVSRESCVASTWKCSGASFRMAIRPAGSEPHQIRVIACR